MGKILPGTDKFGSGARSDEVVKHVIISNHPWTTLYWCGKNRFWKAGLHHAVIYENEESANQEAERFHLVTFEVVPLEEAQVMEVMTR